MHHFGQSQFPCMQRPTIAAGKQKKAGEKRSSSLKKAPVHMDRA